MEFLVILSAWALLYWRGPITPLQSDHWLQHWHRRGGGWLMALPASARLLLVAALPCLLVAVLAWLLAPLAMGIPLFIFELAVLLYSVGRGDLRAELAAYRERWLRGDFEAAYEEALQLGDLSPDIPVEDGAGLHRQMRRALPYLALERWFAVVFWFYLLGPAAALFYRILQWLVQRGSADERQPVRQWLEWLEWLPVRLLGLAFAVTGNFVSCFRTWREQLGASAPAREQLASYAEQALGGAGASADDAAFTERAALELNELLALLVRSAISWLVLFALLQMVR